MVGPAKRLIPLPMFVVTTDGPLKGRVLVVDAEEQILGRRSTSDLVLDDPHVSRAHAAVRKTAGAILVEDLNSTGGTFVNDERVQGSAALKHGDVVKFGNVETRFEDRGSGMAAGDEDTAVMKIEPIEDKPVLSPRQSEVLSYLKDGLTNPEIAEQLGVTERTVKAHCQEVFDRLGARNRTAAVAAAMRMGYFDDEM